MPAYGIVADDYTLSDSTWKSRVAELNTQHVRIEFPMTSAAGSGSFTLANNATASGIEVLILMNQQGSITSGSLSRSSAASAAAANARTFGPGGTFALKRPANSIEVGNEFYYTDPRGDRDGNVAGDAAEICKAIYPAVKAANPRVNVILGCMSRSDGRASVWVNGMYARVPDIHNYCDGWACHPYGPWDGTYGFGETVLMRNLLLGKNAAWGNKLCYITEWGVPATSGKTAPAGEGWPANMTEADAVTQLAGVRSRAEAAGSRHDMTFLDRMYWYHMRNTANVSGDRFPNYGLCTHLDDGGARRKAVFFPYQTAIAAGTSSTGGGTTGPVLTAPVAPATPSVYDRAETVRASGNRDFTFRVKVDSLADRVGVAYTIKKPTDTAALAGPAIADPVPVAIGADRVATFTFPDLPVGTVLNGYFESKNDAGAGEVGTTASNPDLNWSYTVGTLTPATTPATPPAAPATPTSTSSSPPTLSWAAVTDATFYKVYRRPSGGTTDTLVGPNVLTTSYADTGVAAGAWEYRVSAANANGESAKSAPVTITKAAASQAPTSFQFPGLADGLYEVTVTAQSIAGTPASSRTISFRVGSPPPTVLRPTLSQPVITSGTPAGGFTAAFTLGGDAATSVTGTLLNLDTNAVTTHTLLTAPGAKTDAWSGVIDGRYRYTVQAQNVAGLTTAISGDFAVGTPPVPPDVPEPPSTKPPVPAELGESFAAMLYDDLEPIATQDATFDNALRTYVRALGLMFQGVEDLAADRPDDTPGWALLFDVDNAPEGALGYLSMFAGVNPEGLTSGQLRQAIRDRVGYGRGTVQSIVDAARRTLTPRDRNGIPNGRVSVLERAGGDPYALTVITYSPDTPNPDATLQAIMAVKPAGILLDYHVDQGWTYNQAAGAFATYDALAAAFATYNDLRANRPS